MTAVKMPQLGETVIEGTILKWLKQEGDQVALDEPLFEISTDKVDTEVPSSAAGTLTKILVPEGETVAVGNRARGDLGGWGGWRRSSGSCVAARCGWLRRSRDLVGNRRRRRCSLRSGTTRCDRRSGTASRAGARRVAASRFGGGGSLADGGLDADRAAGSWASVADPLAAGSEAGERARRGPLPGERDGDGGADHEERRVGFRGNAGGGGTGAEHACGRPGRPPARPRNPRPHLRNPRPPPRRRSRSLPRRWGVRRSSFRSRTSGGRSLST